jgi:hypothetical protein
MARSQLNLIGNAVENMGLQAIHLFSDGNRHEISQRRVIILRPSGRALAVNRPPSRLMSSGIFWRRRQLFRNGGDWRRKKKKKRPSQPMGGGQRMPIPLDVRRITNNNMGPVDGR